MPILATGTWTFLDLDQVKEQLNITGTDDDAELLRFMDATRSVVEDHTGKLLGQRSVTETLAITDLTPRLRLLSTPVVSVESLVSVDGTVTYDITSKIVRPSGLVILPYSVRGWLTITYTAGIDVPPANYTSAGAIIVQHLWSTQRGNMSAMAGPALADTFGIDQRLGIVAGYAIPNAALELLGPRPPVVA